MNNNEHLETIRWDDLIVGDTLSYEVVPRGASSGEPFYEILLSKNDLDVWTTLNTKRTDQNKLNRETFSALAYGQFEQVGVRNLQIVREDVFFRPIWHPEDIALWQKREEDAQRQKAEFAARLQTHLDEAKIVQARIIDNPKAEISDAQVETEWMLLSRLTGALPQMGVVLNQWMRIYATRLIGITNSRPIEKMPEGKGVFFRGRK